MEITFESAESYIIDSPIVSIDIILNILKNNKTDINYNDALILLSKAILMYLHEEAVFKNDLKDIFNKNLGMSNRKFIAVVLLRLLYYNELCFEDQIFKQNAFMLFDEMFQYDIYKSLKIDRKTQTFEKEKCLKEIVYKTEHELLDCITLVNDIDRQDVFRNKFMKTIRNKQSQIIISPFIDNVLADRLDDVFNSIEKYLESNNSTENNIIEVFENSKRVIDKYISDAEKYGTTYSINYLSNLTKKIKSLLEEHFNNSIYSKPTELVISKLNKKYPLKEIDRSLTLDVLVINDGPGCAFDAVLEVSSDLELITSKITIGDIKPTKIKLPIAAKVCNPTDSAHLNGEIKWKDYSNTEYNSKFSIVVEAQKANLKWEKLEQEEPYSQEPVTSQKELIGRKEILNELIALTRGKSISSSYIYGQKRVGKTSIVKTLATYLQKQRKKDFLVIYLEEGDYVHHDPNKTIEKLCSRLCEEIIYGDERFSSLQIPEFDGSLSPLSSFLRQVHRIVPQYKLLFILDEFDELPIDLYKSGNLGNSFFMTIRSISNIAEVAFVLVGGERMEFIISCQGDKLNKFQPIRVDYFNKEMHWKDFKDLIQVPVKNCMEYSDEALESIYVNSAGNPYFAKKICSNLYNMMIQKRDSFITEDDVENAIKITIDKLESNSFSHFWQDAIFGVNSNVEEISMNRRKVLLAYSECLRREDKFSKSKVIQTACEYLGRNIVEESLSNFERRNIMEDDGVVYNCKIQIFDKWLKTKGFRSIITTFTDLDSVLKHKKEEENAYVRPEEIVNVLDKFPMYKGEQITEGKVRMWLSQFEGNINQRMMFNILRNIKFYNPSMIRTKLKEIYGIIARDIVWNIPEKARKISKRPDILISYVDGPGKSGAYYSNLFADENNIFVNNVVEKSKIIESINSNDKISALVFVDDFIGTGNSAYNYLNDFNSSLKGLEEGRKIKVFFIAICGFKIAMDKLCKNLELQNIEVNVHICDILDEKERCFNNGSNIFRDTNELEAAKSIVNMYGGKLEKSAPLGYGNCEAIVVFDSSCPNNTLPILWSAKNNWYPLFKRL